MLSTMPPPLISPHEAVTLIGSEKVRFVDVRDPRVYAEGHIEGATNMIDLFTYLAMSSDKGVAHLTRTLERVFKSKGLNADDRIITYEGSLNTMYGASCRGWYLFHLLGHSNVQVLDGGLAAWKSEGLPLVTGENSTEVPEGTFMAKWNPDMWANLDEVQSIIVGENSTSKLLDVRDQVEWNGLSSSPYGADFAPRKGRLEGAVHIPWYDFMQPKDPDDEVESEVSHFKSAKDIRRIMDDKGFTVDDDIVLYCFKGARASNSLLALKIAGFNNVRNYFGSWNEWSRNDRLKIDDTIPNT